MGVEEKTGIRLDIGCGENPQPGFVTLDMRPLPHVDIIHDLENFPWPLDDNICLVIVGSHIIEHIKPWLTIAFFNECWRIMKPEGQLALSTPYAGSPGYWQDPTHCNGFNEATFQYFDPSYPLYEIYKPKPWRIEKGFPVWQANGNLEIVMSKLDAPQDSPQPLQIEVGDAVSQEEKIGS